MTISCVSWGEYWRGDNTDKELGNGENGKVNVYGVWMSPRLEDETRKVRELGMT